MDISGAVKMKLDLISTIIHYLRYWLALIKSQSSDLSEPWCIWVYVRTYSHWSSVYAVQSLPPRSPHSARMYMGRGYYRTRYSFTSFLPSSSQWPPTLPPLSPASPSTYLTPYSSPLFLSLSFPPSDHMHTLKFETHLN